MELDADVLPYALSPTSWIDVPEVVAAAPTPIEWLGGPQVVAAAPLPAESLVAPEVVAAAPLPAESLDGPAVVAAAPVQHGPALNQLAGEPGIDGPRTWKARPIECPASLALQAAPPAKAESSAMAEGEVTSTLAAPPAKAASSAMADGEFTITLTPSGQMLSERSQAATNEAFFRTPPIIYAPPRRPRPPVLTADSYYGPRRSESAGEPKAKMPRVEAPPAARPTATWFPAPVDTVVAKAQARPPSRQMQRDAPGESCHDSPGEEEETQAYYTRIKGSQAAIKELLNLGVVRHDFQRREGLWKNKAHVIVNITTVGYLKLGSMWGATSLKLYSKAEAEQHKSRLYGLQQLLEESGEYNVGAHVRVDCTVLARHHDHNDIHIGENVEHLRKAISCPAFSNVLGNIKAAWICSCVSSIRTTHSTACCSTHLVSAGPWLLPESCAIV